MSLPRPKRLYRVTKPNEEPQALQSQHAPYVTSYTSFFSLVFELDVHLFSDSFHSKLWPARAGEGGTFSVKHFKLQFDDLGFDQTSAYDDGRPMRGGRITRGHRVITKHISVEDSEIPSPADDHDDEYVKATSLKPLVQELRILAHPPLRDHSNIVDFLGVAWEKHLDHIGRPWPILVLEYASGGNLREFLNPDPSAMPWSITLSIAQQIACGLSALHDCGVIHGDLKPDNVLIVIENDGRPIAKVSDFGFAIIKSDYAELESSVPPRVRLTGFTPSWEAPEARQGTILLDQAHMIDVYAFGLIFAVMAMGGGNPLGIDVSF
jgi:serine/threonine protein kinase